MSEAKREILRERKGKREETLRDAKMVREKHNEVREKRSHEKIREREGGRKGKGERERD